MSWTSQRDQAGWPGIVEAYQYKLQVDIVQAPSIDAFDVLEVDRRPNLKRFINTLFRPIGLRFANFLADFEYETEKYGFQKAIRQQFSRVVKSVQSHADGNLPPSGPLLFAENHPAAIEEATEVLLAALTIEEDSGGLSEG